MLPHLRALRAQFIRNIKSLRGTNTTRVNSTCCSWRIAPAADGALPCHKKGEVVSFQVSGIPLEPDGSVEADRLRILADGQDAP